MQFVSPMGPDVEEERIISAPLVVSCAHLLVRNRFDVPLRVELEVAYPRASVPEDGQAAGAALVPDTSG